MLANISKIGIGQSQMDEKKIVKFAPVSELIFKSFGC